MGLRNIPNMFKEAFELAFFGPKIDPTIQNQFGPATFDIHQLTGLPPTLIKTELDRLKWGNNPLLATYEATGGMTDTEDFAALVKLVSKNVITNMSQKPDSRKLSIVS